MVFKVTKKGDFFDDNPQAELVEEFEKVSSKDMKYICLVYDYDSMLCNMPVYERKLRALDLLKYEKTKEGNWPKIVEDLMNGGKQKYIDAIMKYRELMSDDDKETLAAYKAQLKECQNFLHRSNKKPSEMTQAVRMRPEMEKLRETIQKLRNDIRIKEGKDAFTVGDAEEETLSLVEEMNLLENTEKDG